MKTPAYVASFFKQSQKTLNAVISLRTQNETITSVRKRTRLGIETPAEHMAQSTASDFPTPVPIFGPTAVQQQQAPTEYDAPTEGGVSMEVDCAGGDVFDHVEETFPLNIVNTSPQAVSTGYNGPQILLHVQAPKPRTLAKIPALIICSNCGHYKHVNYNGLNEDYLYTHAHLSIT